MLGINNESWAILAFSLAWVASRSCLPFHRPWQFSGSGRSPCADRCWGVVALIYITTLSAIGYHAWWPVFAGIVLTAGPWLLGRVMAGREGS